MSDLAAGAERWLATDPAVVDDPYPLWAELLDGPGVVRDPTQGIWLVARHDQCCAVARDHETWSSVLAARGLVRSEPVPAMEALQAHLRAVAAGTADPAVDTSALIDRAQAEAADRLQHTDPPGFTAHRALISRWFTPRRVAELEPSTRSIAADLIDRFGHEVEVLSEMAGPLPGTVIADLLAVPTELRPDFVEWDKEIHGNPRLFAEPDSGEAVAQRERERRIRDWIAGAVSERRGGSGDDLISLLASARVDGALIADRHAAAIAHTFHVGGQETTSKLLGSAMRVLAGDPALQRDLRNDPARIPGFVEEALRFQSPTQGLFRVARHDAVLGGHRVPAGTVVQLLWGAANRDPAVFDDPGRFDAGRTNARSHLAFGHGIHLCPGNHLARLEARVAFEELLARLDDIELAPGNRFDYMSSHVMRGLRRLDLLVRGVG